MYTTNEMEDEEVEAEDRKGVAWFSQPLNIEDMLLSQISQVSATPGSPQVDKRFHLFCLPVCPASYLFFWL